MFSLHTLCLCPRRSTQLLTVYPWTLCQTLSWPSYYLRSTTTLRSTSVLPLDQPLTPRPPIEIRSAKTRSQHHVTSDCGTEFISHFFWSLGKALDMRLHFTSSYHLEGNGQTEHSNQTLKTSRSTATTSRTTGWTYSH